MGNYISCTISHSAYKNCKATKVILPTGELRQFDFPIQAAEMMFETPNFFLVNTKSLKIGGRFCALKADTDLEVFQVYAMFPMKRLNTVVTAADMGKLLVTANNMRKSARVTPEFATVKVVANPESPRRTKSTTPEPGTPRKVKPAPEPEEIARKLKLATEPEKPRKAPRKVKPAPEPEKPRKAPRKVKPAPEPEEIARKLKPAPEPEKPWKAPRKVKPVQAPPPPPPALLIPEYEEEPEPAPVPSPEPEPELELEPAPVPSPEPEQDLESEFKQLPNPCEMEINDIDFSITELKNRLLMCKKKPTLETILEDQPVH